MLLSELFDQLSHGELFNLEMGGDTTMGIDQSDYPLVVSQINLGLTELYKRFELKKDYLTLQLDDDIYYYHLVSANTESNGGYILDSTKSFTDNIIKVERIYDISEVEETEVAPLNDLKAVWPVLFHTDTKLHIPFPELKNQLRIEYRASHATINPIGLNPATTEIELPPALLDPLLIFVGQRVFNAINSGNPDGDGIKYLQRFEQACNNITNFGVVQQKWRDTSKFERDGWV
jgi:hypothetical protein